VIPARSDFRLLLDAAPDAMVVVDRFGLVSALNAEAERFFGWTEYELIGQPMNRVIPTRFHQLLATPADSTGASPSTALKNGAVSCFARRRDGSELPVELARRPLGDGTDAQSLVTLRDLTKWRRAQETRSRDSDARATLESIGDAVITTDASCRVTWLNPVAERLTGWGGAEAQGQPLDALFPLISESSRQPVANTAARCLQEGRSIDLEEGVLLLRRDGTEVPIGDSAAPVRDTAGGTIGVVLVIQDESEKRRVGHRLSYEATHDALTGLVNRREFERRLGRVISNRGSATSEHVLLCLDLDRFKAVNDTCGHDAGDELLRSLGPVLSRHLRKRDTLARIGGDEFGVLLENCPFVHAERIAENLRLEIERYRFEWQRQCFSIGVSIGLIPVSVGNDGIAAVLKAGDAACYLAKEDGGNRVHVEREPHGMAQARSGWVTRLRNAVDGNHFQLYAQPIVSLQPERPAPLRFELLLRLPDGHGQVHTAAHFLPHAERYHIMPAIDRWVVREAIALMGQWSRAHPDTDVPVCAINLSPSALLDDGLLPAVEQELARGGIPAAAICFEISEIAARVNLARTLNFIAGLHATGCEVALEDFGAGVNSFTHLKTLPVDFVKIGGRVVQGVVEDPMYSSIVSAINQIGRDMGIATIAKQIDSTRVLSKIRSLGLAYAQGRAVAPPMPFTDSGGQISADIIPQTV